MATPEQRAWNNGHANDQPAAYQKPKLTGQQRNDIVRRLGEGEKPVDLAVEYGVSARMVRSLRDYVRPS